MFPIKIKNKAEKVFKLCLKKKIKLSFAESCTGGLLSSLITSFPNSSKIFNSGFVTYSNLSKKNLLGVKTVLDIGCSIGYLTTYYALKIPESSFIGIDFSLESVKKANFMKKKLNLNNIDFIAEDMNSINYPDKYFDCIVDTQSIYYSKDYLRTFNHLRKILSDKGLLITIPGIGEKDLIKQYINQIQDAGFLIQDFKFIETINLGDTEYLPAITCSLSKSKEKINIDLIINKLFNSF